MGRKKEGGRERGREGRDKGREKEDRRGKEGRKERRKREGEGERMMKMDMECPLFHVTTLPGTLLSPDAVLQPEATPVSQIELNFFKTCLVGGTIIPSNTCSNMKKHEIIVQGNLASWKEHWLVTK